MSGLTRYVLARPLTAIMAVLCLIVFGASSILNTRMEITPEMNTPMLIVRTMYAGANPEDIDELVSQKIEDSAGALSGIKTITSTSAENMSMVMIQYQYSTDINEAYDDLKKKIDAVTPELPQGADAPVIIEMSSAATADFTMTVRADGQENQYSYVKQNVVPEFEKISTVAEVNIAGGSEDYIKIELKPEIMTQYHLSASSIASDVAAAGTAIPSGAADVGHRQLSISTRLNFDTEESLKKIPLTAAGKHIIYLGDVADIYTTHAGEGSIAHHDGEDTVSVTITKQQSATADEVSREVIKTIGRLTQNNQKLQIAVVNDSADDVHASVLSVAETLILAVAISMIVIWLFFGDLKASAIVGSSIPFSILAALIMMKGMDFSLNMLTMAALTMGVGMMVDNSIVVLESCFRVTEVEKKKGFTEYFKIAMEGTGVVASSVLGSTLTTCVVFIPLAMLSGMAGQLFKPLGYTIVFCMAASLISSITIVPLCYMLYKPEERERAPLSKPIIRFQEIYRRLMKRLLPKKKIVMTFCVGLLVFSFFLASKLDVELMSADDQGQVGITVQMVPGLKTAQRSERLSTVEKAIADYPELKSYISSMGESDTEGSIIAYLKDDRKTKTKDVVELWKKELAVIPDCKIDVEENNMVSGANMDTSNYEVILKSTDYDELKKASDKVVQSLMEDERLTRVHSTLENAAPVIEVSVDAVKAKLAGIAPSMVGASIYQATNGTTATTIAVNGEDVDVKVQYPEGVFQNIDQVKNMVLTVGNGSYVGLSDIADVHFEDSPASITRENKEYTVTISGDYTEAAGKKLSASIDKECVKPLLGSMVSIGSSMAMDMQTDELTSMVSAILTAVFLIFVVLVSQFQSLRYAVMVMLTIPFSLIGAFGLMYVTGSPIGMVTILGFLMLVGTVVNAGILYVDTVTNYRTTMSLDAALIEGGATRLRPILMTTLTTILSMIPMALALGSSGQMIQGLAIVNIGGLTASTVLSLLMLPVYYKIMTKKQIRI